MSLDKMRKRLEYRGGVAQNDRNVKGKELSLKAVLRSQSYNTETIAFLDAPERFFKALINTKKLSNDYDQQTLSIPYNDVCVSAGRAGKTSEGQVPTGVAVGKVFYWQETDSYWICYLRDKDEKAYFKAEIRECKKQVEFDKKKYWVYFRGPDETTIPWLYKTGVSWSDPNYSAVVYITKNEETLDYFHRFKTVKIDGNKWEVVAVDDSGGDGIIELALKEDFNNTLEDNNNDKIEEQRAAAEGTREEKKQEDLPYIEGEINIFAFDSKTYYIKNTEGGRWVIDSKKVKITESTSSFVTIQVTSGKSCNFDINYVIDDEVAASLHITVDSI